MSDVSSFVNNVIGFLHGKKSSQVMIGADAHKLLTDVEEVVAGLEAAGPYGPSIVTDVAKLAGEGAALVASRGLDLPEFLAAGSTLGTLASVLASAERAFLAGMANYRAAAAAVAAAPPKT